MKLFKKEVCNCQECPNIVLDEEVSQKLDKSYNILEYKDGVWTPSNNIYPIDFKAIDRNRKGDRKRKNEVD